MQINNDIVSDYEDYCYKKLTSEFGSFTLGKHNPMHLYQRYKYRIINPILRQVKEPQNLVIPEEHLTAYQKIVSDIQLGNTLNKYQSRNLKRLDYDDDMLSHWRIQHFHLGDTVETDGFVSRTSDLLFIHFSESQAHIIGIFSHGDWCDLDIIETIHLNWPHLLTYYRSDSTRRSLTEDQYKILRKKGYNTTVRLRDGAEYLSPGLGVVANGSPVEAFTNVQRILIKFENSFKEICMNIDQILEADPQRRKTEIATIGLEMDEFNQRFIYIVKETGHRFTLNYA
ncbi:hypothetical protein [Acinetobacter sp. YH12239]|uniref:hypothetical protein n=1 Tax=Acinetobacter sp. YH12239 TaxID=2601166 RepID=UPI0015D30F86|nr:hypothetical protein [Acinetobacter sp. YH12239]